MDNKSNSQLSQHKTTNTFRQVIMMIIMIIIIIIIIMMVIIIMMIIIVQACKDVWSLNPRASPSPRPRRSSQSFIASRRSRLNSLS